MAPSSATLLSNRDIVELTEWRHLLHRNPELSGEEIETAGMVKTALAGSHPDEVIEGIGGHGVAAIYVGAEAGPTVMLRCELDALPIEEIGDLAYKSATRGKAHLCGHDGHMAIIAGVSRWVGRNRPTRGRVVLLFQPAEEDGAGAKKVIADPKFQKLSPDYALSLHNFPGIAMGHAVLASGLMNCASRGMKIRLLGRTAHASDPDKGVSPALAMSEIVTALSGFKRGRDPRDPEFFLTTVTHAHLGEMAFGVAPGHAEIWATLRTREDIEMKQLVEKAERHVASVAKAQNLGVEISYHDVFRHCANDPEAVEILANALEAENIPYTGGELPMRASEDFGRFGAGAKSAMFLLGSGQEVADLHNPDFDFPDELIPIGTRVFVRALQSILY